MKISFLGIFPYKIKFPGNFLYKFNFREFSIGITFPKKNL